MGGEGFRGAEEAWGRAEKAGLPTYMYGRQCTYPPALPTTHYTYTNIQKTEHNTAEKETKTKTHPEDVRERGAVHHQRHRLGRERLERRRVVLGLVAHLCVGWWANEMDT